MEHSLRYPLSSAKVRGNLTTTVQIVSVEPWIKRKEAPVFRPGHHKCNYPSLLKGSKNEKPSRKPCAKIDPVAGFQIHSGKIAVYAEDNVDTDRIIPARFLSRVSRSGYGELLFSDVRGAGFALDQPAAQGASILVAGTNFGCGSSREHAVWAIQQAGFQAVVARKTPTSPGYSDIFRQNAANCGLLLVELEDAAHARLAGLGSGAEATIDLPEQTVTFAGESVRFEINPVTKAALVEGLDLIGTTLRLEDAIERYERESGPFVPRGKDAVAP